MNIETDQDPIMNASVHAPVRPAPQPNSLKIKLVFVAVAVVTVVWLGVLLYLGRELVRYAFG